MNLRKTIQALRAEIGAYREEKGAARSLSSRFPMAASLAAFQQRMSRFENTCQEEPIFVLANSFRSGSTYLQRLIMSACDAVLWGEPYDRANFVGRLAETLRFFENKWPPDEFFIDAKPGFARDGTRGLTTDWIANLYPAGEYVLKAHQAFMLQLLKTPVQQLGATRWGFKEVRLTIEHALYLKLLFPKAKVLFLYRNPYDAYLSYRAMRETWHLGFPDDPLTSARKFGSHWRSLLEGFIDGHQRVDGLLVCYESLCSDQSVGRQILDYLGCPDSQVGALEVIGGQAGWVRPDRRFLSSEISRVELWSLKRQVEPLASKLGYEGPSV